jgi:alpha-glucosidase (family GH31 glycosyl hydrolase)
MLDTLYQRIKFDGVWLDMNELSNFCNGPCTTPLDTPIFDYTHDLPYNPGNDPIETSTIPLNCTHYDNISEANVHVYHGLLQTHATNVFLKAKNLQPFILSRSSTFGTSKYGMHWTGDNNADW